MQKKIIFFDIDGVLFDSRRFLNDFYIQLSQKLNLTQENIQELENFYHEVKKEKGFFDPESLLNKISLNFLITKEELDKLWWDDVRFQQCLLVNLEFFEKLQEKAIIGIFSKGEKTFQNRKLEEFQAFISPQNIYIFENKIIKIEGLLNNYRDYKVYIVDDNQAVLENFKRINKNVITIFVRQDLNAGDYYVTALNGPESFFKQLSLILG